MITIETFKIADKQAHDDWEKFLGFKIYSYEVRIPREFYLEHAAAIQSIQMMGAFRRSVRDE